jgi:hypothetical protein
VTGFAQAVIVVVVTAEMTDVLVVLVERVLGSMTVVVMVASVMVFVESTTVVTPDVTVLVLVITLRDVRVCERRQKGGEAIILGIGSHCRRLCHERDTQIGRAKGRGGQLLTSHSNQSLDDGT